MDNGWTPFSVLSSFDLPIHYRLQNQLLTLFIIFSNLSLAQNAGIFQTYAILDSGSGNTYYAGGFNADGAPNVFNGQNFGVVTTLTLNGGEIKTFKKFLFGLADDTASPIGEKRGEPQGMRRRKCTKKLRQFSQERRGNKTKTTTLLLWGVLNFRFLLSN